MVEEKRTEVRLLCADMLQVTWKSEAGDTRAATALLEDISRSGACLQLDGPIPVGVELTLRSPGQELSGVVRYCVYREIGYFVGLQFEPDSKWSPGDFQPQHLLDLKDLACLATQDSGKPVSST
jgi:hypothetical protein